MYITANFVHKKPKIVEKYLWEPVVKNVVPLDYNQSFFIFYSWKFHIQKWIMKPINDNDNETGDNYVEGHSPPPPVKFKGIVSDSNSAVSYQKMLKKKLKMAVFKISFDFNFTFTRYTW